MLWPPPSTKGRNCPCHWRLPLNDRRTMPSGQRPLAYQLLVQLVASLPRAAQFGLQGEVALCSMLRGPCRAEAPAGGQQQHSISIELHAVALCCQAEQPSLDRAAKPAPDRLPLGRLLQDQPALVAVLLLGLVEGARVCGKSSSTGIRAGRGGQLRSIKGGETCRARSAKWVGSRTACPHCRREGPVEHHGHADCRSKRHVCGALEDKRLDPPVIVIVLHAPLRSRLLPRLSLKVSGSHFYLSRA